MITASQLRTGMAIKYEGQKYKVLAADYHPGQGKMGGVTHVRLQNLSTATFWEHSFRSDLKLEEITVDRYALEFLYADADQCYFMNPESYEQTEIEKSVVGPQAEFLLPGMKLSVEFVEGRPVRVLFPEFAQVSVEIQAKRLEWPMPEFVSEECRRIEYIDGWPQWPYLPMKNMRELEGSGLRKLGYLVNCEGEFPNRVVLPEGICPCFGISGIHEGRRVSINP